MAHLVVRGEINTRCFVSFFRDQFVKRRQSAISQKYRAGLCVQRFDMTHAVVFFFGPRQFMLLNNAREIFRATGDGHQPDLAVAAHHLPVKIETRPGVLPERAVGDQPSKILLSFRINFRRASVGAGREVNFRFADMQKAQWIARRQLAGFLGRHHVVRQFANPLRKVRPRSQCGERVDCCHKKRQR